MQLYWCNLLLDDLAAQLLSNPKNKIVNNLNALNKKPINKLILKGKYPIKRNNKSYQPKISRMAMYDNANTIAKSFNLAYISAYLLQAQWAEFVELKKVITNLSKQQNKPISILDIGI